MSANEPYFLNVTVESPASPTSQFTSLEERNTLELTQAVILCTVLGVASVLGTLGNLLVLTSIIKFDYLREIPDFFIFSLSLSDFLVTAIFQPLQAYKVTHLIQVSGIVAFSEITSLLGHISLIASISNMFGVTVERLISIRFPLKYDFLVTKFRAKVTIICIWFFSLSYGTVWTQDLAPKEYMAIYFVLVLVGTASIYFYIFLIARRLEGRMVQTQRESTDAGIPNRRRERKAAKTIATILGVAALCWLPLLIVPNVLPKNLDHATFMKIFFPLQTLSVCNSSINPYIYCVRSSRYSVAFTKLLGLQKIFNYKVQAKDTKGLSVCRTQGDVPKPDDQAPQKDIKDVAL